MKLEIGRSLTINKVIKKRICSCVAGVIIAIASIVVIYALWEPSVRQILSLFLLLPYNAAGFSLLLVTKRKIKKREPFDYDYDRKEPLQPEKAYKNIKILSIVNNTLLIIEMVIMAVYNFIAGDQTLFMVNIASMGIGARLIVRLARK